MSVATKEHGTLFQLSMVTALLDDIKTQTRRGVKLPHQNPLGKWEPMTFGGDQGGRTATGKSIPLQGGIWHTRTGEGLGCPYGAPGARIWVRETFYAFGRWETRFNVKKGRDEWHFVDLTIEAGFKHLFEKPAGWEKAKRGSVLPTWWKRPAIFMPRVASRITLEITAVRAEHLQDISEADAIAEGVRQMRDGSGTWVGREGPGLLVTPWLTARDAYRDLWESINGLGTWALNPFVWVIEFKRITP